MTHLKIEQNSTPERVSSSLITALYNLSQQQLDGTSNLVGELVTDKYGRSRINTIQTRFPNLHITATEYAIEFADSEVENICVTNWGSDGMITETEAQVVTSFNNVFQANTDITSFAESSYFRNVTSLNANEFRECTNLQNFDFSNIRSIGIAAFYKSGLSGNHTINITSGGIGQQTFADCPNLKKVTLTGVTWLGPWVFSGSGVEELNLPSTLSALDNNTGSLSGMASLQSLDLSTTQLTVFPKQVCYNNSSLTSVTLPAATTTLGNQMFEGCTSLPSIDLSATQITEVSQRCFYGASSLATVQLPQGCVRILAEAFRNCASLTSFDFTNIVKIGDNAFRGAGLTTVYIPDTCTSLKSVSGTGTSNNFTACLNLTTARIPSWLTDMGQMFQGCQNLETISNTSQITYLGAYGLVNCKKLKVLEVGAVTKIDNYALQAVGSDVTGGCALLLNATTPPQLGTNWKMGARLVIYVPDAAISTYNSDSAWSSITVYPMSSYTPT